ncbi:MAG TPA: nickel pincer cofactor biosynthesis protein LarC [Ilumatobacteraceae bacterium]|nr:nickel pincer cofactor biosynthesis protein LarC [Ilumatobacteraceae bacterium]
MTRTAWFHCFAGTAGDMTMAALIDAGANPDAVAQMVAGVALDGYSLTFERVQRCGLAATLATVAVLGGHDHDHDHHDHHHHDQANATYPALSVRDKRYIGNPAPDVTHRGYGVIRGLLEQAELPGRVRDRAQRVFLALAEVEAAMHDVSVDQVESHEVGSTDAIVDIVGACAALEDLGIERIICSPITVGMGTIRGAAHGDLPNPAPATAALLARRSAPSRGLDDHRELATPTGVALMTALADEFGPMPSMTITASGHGAGRADTPGRPNVVQVVIGDSDTASNVDDGQPVTELCVNVDDTTGEVIAHTIAVLLDAGAYDAWATPIVMKKGRPAYTLHALCDHRLVTPLRELLVSESGSLGVRATSLQRWPQQRREHTVDVDGHPIRVKISGARRKVEFDDAAAAASALGLPVRDVIRRAESQELR